MRFWIRAGIILFPLLMVLVIALAVMYGDAQ